MKKWLVTLGIMAALVVLALTARFWLAKFLTLLGAHGNAIQALSSLGQLVLWAFAILALPIRFWISERGKSKDTARQAAAPRTANELPPADKPRPTPRPTRGVVSALHQLPPPPRDFTGRAAELAELLGRIDQGGATISGLQGQGGVGKTALALRLAEELAPRYPDAQFYLDLRGHDERRQQPLTPSEAMAHVLRAYHPTARLPDTEAELRAQYLSVLHGQRALLLMDNARDAAQVTPLIPPAGCVLLVTSRRHFTLPGLYAKRLDELPPADARKLLATIAPRVGPHADEIAKLCAYLPLALRLAASALAERPDLSPADYARRLADAKQRLKLLDKIDASLDLSYELLSPELQQRWRALAVFPATFDARAASAVWQTDPDATQDALGELIKFSLLEWDDATARYSLHDLARLFADRRLSEDERHIAQSRHAEHYAVVLDEADNLYLRGGEAISHGLALFDAEVTNIRAGQAWAASHAGDGDLAARLCFFYPDAGAYLLNLRLHPRERINWLEQSLAAARKLNDRVAESHSLGSLGLAYAELGEPRRAAEFHEQYLEFAREIGDRWGEGKALGNLGIAYRQMGEPRRAIEFYEQVLLISRETGDRRSEGNSLGNLGNAYTDLGDSRRAIELHEQDLTICREIGDRRGEGEALGNLGNAYASLGDSRRAVEFYEQQLKVTREIGDRGGEARALWNMSLVLMGLGDRGQAIAWAEASLKICEEIEEPRANKVREQLEEWRGGKG